MYNHRLCAPALGIRVPYTKKAYSVVFVRVVEFNDFYIWIYSVLQRLEELLFSDTKYKSLFISGDKKIKVSPHTHYCTLVLQNYFKHLMFQNFHRFSYSSNHQFNGFCDNKLIKIGKTKISEKSFCLKN